MDLSQSGGKNLPACSGVDPNTVKNMSLINRGFYKTSVYQTEKLSQELSEQCLCSISEVLQEVQTFYVYPYKK